MLNKIHEPHLIQNQEYIYETVIKSTVFNVQYYQLKTF